MGTSSHPRRAGGYRSVLPFAVSFTVVAVVVGSMFQVFHAGQERLSHARDILSVEVLWNWATNSAVLALHSYALTGDEDALAGYEAAIALPRAIRPSIRASREFPGNAEAVRAAIASQPLIANQADVWAERMERHGGTPAAIAVAESRFQKDSLLQLIETEAVALEAAVSQEGPGAPLAQAAVARIRGANLEIRELDAPLVNQLRGQEVEAEASMERSMRYTALALLLGGGALVGLLLVRARKAESSVVDSEARFRQMAESVQEVFWLVEASPRRFLYVSPAYASIWGRPVAELYDNPRAWLEGVHPEDRDRVRATSSDAPTSPRHQEYRVVTPSGDVRHVRARGFPIRDDEGTVIRVAGVVEDVTRRKQLEEELVQSQKLRSVGRLAGGVAHEFNNLLTVIQGHLLLLLSEREGDDDLREELEEALRATRRAADVTRNLLSFAGHQILRPQRMDLAGFVRESEEMIRGLLPAEVELETWLEDELMVRVDPSFMHEMLLTLTSRAMEAMPDGGVLWIRAARITEAGPITVEGGTLPEGSWSVLLVEDTGDPIPEDAREHLFEPFGPQHKGKDDTRLELSSVFGIAEQSGGGIRVEPRHEGRGSRFALYLPVIDDGEPASETPDAEGVETGVS